MAVLGEGAFAKVYLARQHGMAGRLVALKLTFRQTHESHWLATLQHSAIVPIYSTHRVGEVNGICMPFLGNTTLADLLPEGSSVTALHKSNWWSTSKRKSQRGGRTVEYNPAASWPNRYDRGRDGRGRCGNQDHGV